MAAPHSGDLPRLTSAEFLQRPETKAVFAALIGSGFATRVVGGAVRAGSTERPRKPPGVLR